MKLNVTKDCEDSLVCLVALRLSGIKTEVSIVPSDTKSVPFLKVSKQIPSLELDSGDYLFTVESILYFLIPSEEEAAIAYLTSADICLSSLNNHIPAKSLFGENEVISWTDMVLWSKLHSTLQALKASKSLYCNHPRLGFWFDKVASQSLFTTSVTELGYTPSKSSKPVSESGKIGAPKQKNTPVQSQKQVKKPVLKADAVENFLQVHVTEQQKVEGVKRWKNGFPSMELINNEQHPKLPINGKKNNLITSALPYVNNVPHLGNIIGAVLSADAFARYCRLKNENTLYICGTDEYGTATETKALAEGMTPQQICDKYHVLHRDIYEWFNISFDFFGRTTTKQQTEIAQDIFWKVHNNGYTVEETVEQLYCCNCQKFLADRYVEGGCPFCDYDDARGDQCDKCSKLINPVELKNPKCKVCSSSPEIRTSKHLFLDLPKLEDRIKKFTDEREALKTYNGTAISITNSWLKTGLKPRCITRDLKWGTPVPHKDYEGKVFYVWFDAPIGYISITANYMKEWEKWWKNPEQVTLHQFMAKDNVPFHSVVFPASLMAANDNYTMITTLDGIDWLQYEGTKFSKSRGTGVFGDQVIETNIPCDIFRCYLLLSRPETSDTNFTWDGLAQVNNNILLNNLGNFILRALTFCKNSFNSEIPEINLNSDDEHLLALINGHLTAYFCHFDGRMMSRAFEVVFAISKVGNQYLQYNTPWVLAKGTPAEKARAGSVIGLAANISALLSVIISPFMPTISNIIQEQLNMPDDRKYFVESFSPILKAGHTINSPFPLFSKIDEAFIKSLQNRFSGQDSSASATSAAPFNLESLQKEIEKQGNIVRDLKGAKADPEKIKSEVQILLNLKKQLPEELQAKGKPAKAANKPAPKAQPKENNPPKPKVEITPEIAALQEKIATQGNVVRNLKGSNADKGDVDAAVKLLLELKSQLPVELQPQPSKKGKKKK